MTRENLNFNFGTLYRLRNTDTFKLIGQITESAWHTVNPCIKPADINIFYALQMRALLECGYC